MARRLTQRRLLMGLVAIALTLSLGLAQGAIAQQRPRTSPNTRPTPSLSQEMVTVHNRYRAEVNVPPLTWSDTLARNAQQWANQLAARGGRTLEHSEVRGEGENLWMGTSGYFTYSDMVNGWGEEKQYFRAGVFPNVSTTGNWTDVGHYTQMVWRNTRQVGCGIATAGGNDILVCRYSPPGNYLRQRVY